MCAQSKDSAKLVWDKDENPFICPLSALKNPSMVHEQEKGSCIAMSKSQFSRN